MSHCHDNLGRGRMGGREGGRGDEGREEGKGDEGREGGMMKEGKEGGRKVGRGK